MEGLFTTFTPVRRRQDTIVTKTTSLDDGKSWTTARCNRLLRPLISKVSALGRLSPSENNSTKNKPTSIHRTKYEKIKDEDSSLEDDNGDEDDEWAPVRKKLKRTYSARSGKSTRGRPPKISSEKRNQEYSDIRQRMPFLVPGEISVPTPILNRTKGGPELDLGRSESLDETLEGKRHKRPKSRYLTKDGEAHFELSEILRRLRRKTDASRYTLYEGIYNGLEVLLKATMADVDPMIQDRTGTRSLFSICLRTVPVVIKDEEEIFALEAGERSAVEVKDVSSEIYAELEALGHGNRGWKHLRTIVRAHGMQIIGDAITQGLVKTDFARALVLLCVHTACLEEAEQLISCLLKVTTCQDPKSIHSRTCDESSMFPLSVLDKFACYTGRRSFQVRQLKDMLISERLPLLWLATKEFSVVWTHVIQSSALDPDSSSFLTELLPKLCISGTKIINFASTESVMQKALDGTFASVLTALSAISLLNAPKEHESSSNFIECLQKSGTVLRQCLVACIAISSPLNDNRASLLAISNLLISSELEIHELFRQVSKMLSFIPTQKSNNSIASFISSVACCCGRGAFNSGFDHLQVLHSRLREYFMSQSCSNKRMIREVIIDSAFTFARRHDDSEHLDYAEDIESEYHGEQIADLPRRLLAEDRDDVSAGFRWEEGISEWVTTTPAFALNKAVKPRDDRGDDNVSSSPLRQNPRRGCSKRQAAPRMFTQVTKHMKPSQQRIDTGTAHRQKEHAENIVDLSSESEDDLLDASLTSMVSHHTSSSLLTLSQSTETESVGVKKSFNARVLRPKRHGLRGQANWQLDNQSDDELSSSTTSWNTSIIKRNKISVNIILPSHIKTNTYSTVEKQVSDGGIDNSRHRYSTRRKSALSLSKMAQQQKRKRADDTDSEDELCL